MNVLVADRPRIELGARLQWRLMTGNKVLSDQPSPPPAAEGPESLVSRIEAGDPRAEEDLVARYGRSVALLLQRHTGGRPEAEDLFQDTFALALTKLRRGELRQPSRLPGYLAGIARSLAIEQYRKVARRKTEANTEVVDDRARAPAEQLGELLRSETAELVRQLLTGLRNERDRELLFRFYVAEEERRSIAADFGLDNLQFNRVLHRARQRYKVLYLAQQKGLDGQRRALLGVANVLFMLIWAQAWGAVR